MEDVATYNSPLPAHTMPEKALLSIGRSMSRVKIKLTRQQLGSVAIIMQIYAHRAEANGVYELAQLREVYLLAEKLRTKVMHGKQSVKLTLNMTEAAAMYNVFDNTDFAEFARYEGNLALYIIMEIDKQTI